MKEVLEKNIAEVGLPIEMIILSYLFSIFDKSYFLSF